MKKLTKREKLEKKLDKLILQKSELLEKGKEYNGFVGFMKAIDEEPIKGIGKAALVETIDKYLDIEKNTKQYTWTIKGIRSEMKKENKRKISDMQMFFLNGLAKMVHESKEHKIIGTKTNLLKRLGLFNYSFHIPNEKEEEKRSLEMKFFFKATDLKIYTVYGQYLDLLWKTFYVPLNNALATSKRNTESEKYFPFMPYETIALYLSDGTSRETTPNDEELISEAVSKHPKLMQAYDHKYHGKDFWEFQNVSKEALNDDNVKAVLPSIVLQMNPTDGKKKDYDGFVPFWASTELNKEKARNLLISSMLKEYLQTEPEEKDLAIFLTYIIIDHFDAYKSKEQMFSVMSRAKLCAHSIAESRPSMYNKNLDFHKKNCPKPRPKFNK